MSHCKWRLNPVWNRMLCSCTHMATVGVESFGMTVSVVCTVRVSWKRSWPCILEWIGRPVSFSVLAHHGTAQHRRLLHPHLRPSPYHHQSRLRIPHRRRPASLGRKIRQASLEWDILPSTDTKVLCFVSFLMNILPSTSYLCLLFWTENSSFSQLLSSKVFLVPSTLFYRNFEPIPY